MTFEPTAILSVYASKLASPPASLAAQQPALGGILLGLGARIASGCNVKFFLGALPLLAYQGLFFFGAAAIGAFLGTKILTQYVIR